MPCHPDRVRRNYYETDAIARRAGLIFSNHVVVAVETARAWRSHADNDAEQLERRGITANVIEGDPLEPDLDNLWAV